MLPTYQEITDAYLLRRQITLRQMATLIGIVSAMDIVEGIVSVAELEASGWIQHPTFDAMVSPEYAAAMALPGPSTPPAPTDAQMHVGPAVEDFVRIRQRMEELAREQAEAVNTTSAEDVTTGPDSIADLECAMRYQFRQTLPAGAI